MLCNAIATQVYQKIETKIIIKIKNKNNNYLLHNKTKNLLRLNKKFIYLKQIYQTIIDIMQQKKYTILLKLNNNVEILILNLLF